MDKSLKRLARTGQVSSFAELEALVLDFEQTLVRYGVAIKSRSELEAACCSVLEVLGKQQQAELRKPNEDVRLVFTEVLGIWTFLKKVVRLQNHPSFAQFGPHLALLNKGTVVQNKRLRASEDASNKIFELLFALVLLDVSDDVLLAHPDLEDISNPDILVRIEGRWWGFACKAVYGPSGKTFFANLKKAVEQIEASKAEIGCVMVSFRNLLDHQSFWPVLNEREWRAGAEPIFAAYLEPAAVVGPKIWKAVEEKRNQVAIEIGYENVLNIFAGKKAVPAFLAFAQTCSGKAAAFGPIPTSVVTLSVGTFADVSKHSRVFERVNLALHERSTRSLLRAMFIHLVNVVKRCFGKTRRSLVNS